MLEIGQIRRCDANLERARLELAHQLSETARHPAERFQLRVEPCKELVRLEAPLALMQHYLEGVLLEQRNRVELWMQHARDRVRLRERLPHEREAGRQRDPILERDPLKVRECLAGADPGQRSPVVTRQLPPKLLDESWLVGAEARP